MPLEAICRCCCKNYYFEGLETGLRLFVGLKNTLCKISGQSDHCPKVTPWSTYFVQLRNNIYRGKLKKTTSVALSETRALNIALGETKKIARFSQKIARFCNNSNYYKYR